MASAILFNTDPDNGLLADGTKPLLEPMLASPARPCSIQGIIIRSEDINRQNTIENRSFKIASRSPGDQ